MFSYLCSCVLCKEELPGLPLRSENRQFRMLTQGGVPAALAMIEEHIASPEFDRTDGPIKSYQVTSITEEGEVDLIDMPALIEFLRSQGHEINVLQTPESIGGVTRRGAGSGVADA